MRDLSQELESKQQKRVAALLAIAQLGYAHWFGIGGGGDESNGVTLSKSIAGFKDLGGEEVSGYIRPKRMQPEKFPEKLLGLLQAIFLDSSHKILEYLLTLLPDSGSSVLEHALRGRAFYEGDRGLYR
jgi:hypothetical protein